MGAQVVATSTGRWRGEAADDLVTFLGIRYAAPPLGELRFRPPQPYVTDTDIADATGYGPLAPQATGGFGVHIPGDPLACDEDCLYLNIWTPACDGERRPVLVFVHGGALLAGGGSSALYRGTHLARAGAVVVTFNYRLGVLGFLAHPGLEDPSGIGNWGLFDQLAVLEWVRANVAGFGGDPSNVTLFGESAGAMSIGDLLATDRARGLVRRAVLQSGATAAVWPEAAIATAEAFASHLGRAAISRDALRAVPVDELLAAQAEVVGAIDNGVGIPFRPVIDGGLFSEHPSVAFASGAARGIELIVGTNRDEFKFFSAISPELSNLDDDAFLELIARYLEGSGQRELIAPKEVFDAYRTARTARGERSDARAMLDAFGTDWIFRIPAIRLLEAQVATGTRCYAYRFDWESPFSNGALGACHGLELPFVFGSVDQPIVALFSGGGDVAEVLSAQMRGAWVAFARNGDPSHDSLGAWPTYDLDRRATMVLGPESHLEDAPQDAERAFWAEHLGAFGSAGAIEARRSFRTAWLGREDGAAGT
jgi:para-nitrobenzyl esterase